MDMNKFSLVTSLSGITMKYFFLTWHLGFNHPQLTHILALNMFISHCWFLHSEQEDMQQRTQLCICRFYTTYALPSEGFFFTTHEAVSYFYIPRFPEVVYMMSSKINNLLQVCVNVLNFMRFTRFRFRFDVQIIY